MQTNIHPALKDRDDVKEAEAILRSCVHCGFCNATCPTYQLLGDERDGPRGRIYLLKQMLETNQVSEASRIHMDRCLTCRSCETTCPSGVRYARLADIGRGLIEEKLPRSGKDKYLRQGLSTILPKPQRLQPLLQLAQLARGLMPEALRSKVPARQTAHALPTTQHPRKMLMLAGCVQQAATPRTNAAAARVLDQLGITLEAAPEAGCCGALDYHLQQHDDGLDAMRRNIDAWWPHIEQGVEAIVISASGCGAMLKDYGDILRNDPRYVVKAETVSALAKDLSEVLLAEDPGKLRIPAGKKKTAVHCPCTLQHALKQSGNVETILINAGFELARTRDNHLCCGSAGTYSLLQPELSQTLLGNKIAALSIDHPEQIVTANIGCQLHLGARATVPVKHWIELLDPIQDDTAD